MALAVAVVVPLLGAQTTANAAARAAGKLVPPKGVLLGAYVDPDARWTGNEDAFAEVTAFEQAVGRTLDIDQHYYSWTNTFPSGLEQWDLAAGRTPLISWDGTRLDDVLSGTYDSMIRERAAGVKALGKPVFLRWCWEMNGEWSGCGGANNNSPGKTDGPAKWVAAWRHIHDLFTEVGADNVVWVWSPNDRDVPTVAWNHWTRYYPGDAYVDWVGVDGYNWGATQSWSSWTDFASLFAAVYRDYVSRKPIMIAETASVEQGGDKASWITTTGAALKRQFPDIAALVWFDVNKEADWRPDSSARALTAFRQLAQDPYFGGESDGSGGDGGDGGDDGSTRTGTAAEVTNLTLAHRPAVRRAVIRFKISRWARVTLTIHRSTTLGVVRHRLHRLMAPGAHAVTWFGHNDRRAAVPVGYYRARVVATRDGRTRSDVAAFKFVR